MIGPKYRQCFEVDPRGGHLGIFLGGYVPPGSKLAPRSKKNFP